MSFLRQRVEQWAARPGRYGPRDGGRADAWRQIDHELDLIERLGFPGYFLIVSDIVEFCRRADIYCQGRGSAANSAVCYALDITKADAVGLGLLFERFLSPERDGPPDIDLDIESDRREEVIQYVYERYGRANAAQVANVITYRAKSAVRDMAKALGYATGQQDAWSKQVDPWGPLRRTIEQPDHEIPAPVLALAAQVEHFPRHLGIHSGGMVLCDRPVVEVCPVEWGRMEDRSVLQWDKDDCAAVGLVKFDLLGLGMLSALHNAVDLVRGYSGREVDLADLDQDPEVYEMLCRADSVGVFQVESRAQMATLPRLRPRTFYDLVVEVALIRPGPIQGGSVHPYIRRRNGVEPVTYLHPLLEPALHKTLGVPLFQEQLMQLAIDVAGFTPGESDELRQAMGAKRSQERMQRLRQRLYDGMAARGITGEVADEIYEKLAAFANYGFPESHSVSFAYLVYASSWLKRYEPAAFCAGLLNAQPMGFYSPHTLVQDARRHGVEVRTPDVNASAAKATLEVDAVDPDGPGNGPGAPPSAWGRGGPAVRLGIGSVRGVGEELAERIASGRPYAGMEDVARRTGASLEVLEAMATAGAFAGLDGGLDRRRALWSAGAVAQSRAERLAGTVTGASAPVLPGMSPREESTADLWATGVSPEGHPTRFVREELERLGVITAAGLADATGGRRVVVGGVVTHRQRPATAGGTMFLNLEDETGLVNVVCSKGCWVRHRRVARSAPALLIRGRLEKAEGVINVVAEKLEPLPMPVPGRSRDFR
jgi:error-prone DNA polymerase